MTTEPARVPDPLGLVTPEQVAAAVVSVRGVASRTSAALLWGIELVRPPEEPEVAVGRDRSRMSRPGVRVHRAVLPPEHLAVVRGVPATSPVRTVLDLARSLPLAEAVAAADSALRLRLCTYEQLVAAVAALAPSRGRPACRAVLERVDRASGSVLESLCRVVLEDGGLRPFETQLVVRTLRGAVGRVDFAWPEQRVLVEVDGFAFHADRMRYREDRRRTNALVLAGWRVLRFSWEDVLHRPEVVVAQVRAALHA